MEYNSFYVMGTDKVCIAFGSKRMNKNRNDNVRYIYLQKNLIDLKGINEYMKKFYEEKYKQHWDDNDKHLYGFDDYSKFNNVFVKALNLAYDDVMLIVDNFDDFTFYMKMKVLFEVVDMTIRHKKKNNKDDKAQEIIASLNSI